MSDKRILDAIRAQNNGQHTQAAILFQRAGNETRQIGEKETLWKAAANARKIAASD